MASHSDDGNLAKSAVGAASSLILLQLLSRLVTFGLNQALVRLASPEVFGTASIQFELLLSTILFLSREGFRNTLLRAPAANENSKGEGAHTKDRDAQLATNIAFLPVPAGTVVALTVTAIYRALSSYATRSQPHFDLSVALYAFAAICELLSEPFYIRAQNQLRFSVRVKAEGFAVILRTLATLAILVGVGGSWGLVAFSVGQAVYGLTILGAYLVTYGGFGQVLPRPVRQAESKQSKSLWFDIGLLRLSLTMTAQSIVKHFLTEGDKLAVSYVSPLRDQGGYAVASNYGSLIARIAFQPIEETSRLFFSKTLSSEPQANASPALRDASAALHILLRFYTHLALVFLSFGPPFVPTLLSILLPKRYLETSAPQVLQSYCTYLPVMAFNGFLEAFVSSTSDVAQLRRQSQWMVVFSAIFILSCYVFVEILGWGETGLVWANIVNLGCRAAYSWKIAQRFFRSNAKPGSDGIELSLQSAVPPSTVLVAFGLSAIVVRWNEPPIQKLSFSIAARHFGLGATCFVACLGICFATQRAALRDIFNIVRRKKTA